MRFSFLREFLNNNDFINSFMERCFIFLNNNDFINSFMERYKVRYDVKIQMPVDLRPPETKPQTREN